MRINARHSLCTLLILTAVSLTLGYDESDASPGPRVNVRITGFLPAPPGVFVRIDSGRPYYVENERRVYLERERPRHSKQRHHGRGRGHSEEHAGNFGRERRDR